MYGQCPPSHPAFRISRHYDSKTSGTADGSDPTYYFCHDDRWRIIATFRGSDSDPKERFVYHNAGLGGSGGGSYIDAMILAERDETAAFTAAADGTLEKRRSYGQKRGGWRSDTAMLATDTGKLIENVKYYSNGVGNRFAVGDTDGDGDWDATDSATIGGGGGYDVLKDADMDGDVDSNDITQANAFGGYTSTPLGTISIVENRKGYAGYELEPNLTGSKFHVRNRVLDGELGRWTKRDPLGYVDGMTLYGYAADLSTTDPLGLNPERCSQLNTDPVPTVPSTPGSPCHRQSSSAICKFLCGNQKSATNGCGQTPSGIEKVCCVCDKNINNTDELPWSNPEAQPLAVSCVEDHEKWHRDQQPWCISNQAMGACCELTPTQKEIECLAKAWQKCKSRRCRDAINDRQQGLNRYYLENQQICKTIAWM